MKFLIMSILLLMIASISGNKPPGSDPGPHQHDHHQNQDHVRFHRYYIDQGVLAKWNLIIVNHMIQTKSNRKEID